MCVPEPGCPDFFWCSVEKGLRPYHLGGEAEGWDRGRGEAQGWDRGRDDGLVARDGDPVAHAQLAEEVEVAGPAALAGAHGHEAEDDLAWVCVTCGCVYLAWECVPSMGVCT